MEDNSLSGSGRNAPQSGDRLAVDAAALLISDDAAWQRLPPTKSALGCGSVQKLGVSRRSGDLITSHPRCRTYGHRPCAEAKVKEYLETIERNLGDDRSGWVAVVDEDAFDSSRLRDRLYRQRSNHSDYVRGWYRFVKRSDGTRWILSNVLLEGRLPPVSMEPVDDLLLFAAKALHLPGVEAFLGTPWPIKSPNSEISDMHSFGTFTDEGKEVFLRAAADEVERRFGVRVDPEIPLVYANGITVEQYIECGETIRYGE